MNCFIEGLQGSGKTTLLRKLAENNPQLKAAAEGDYSPVELAWCALVSEEQYAKILSCWKDLAGEIEQQSHREATHRVICYTHVKGGSPDFYRQMENYEIYCGRVSFDQYCDTVLERYRNWQGDGCIFECSLLQNAADDMILYRDMSDEEIPGFFKEVRSALEGREYRILYLETADIAKSLNRIRKERTDGSGRELWYMMMCEYFSSSPYAKKRALNGGEGLMMHLKHRQELELRICREIFSDRAVILKAGEYGDLNQILIQR